MRSVVITGVSTGIGQAAARVLAQRGMRVFGSVRKVQDADQLAQELGEHFVPLVFDVVDGAAVKAAADTVRQALAGSTLAGLVNNAGIAVSGPLLEVDIEDFRQQLEVNIIGVHQVTQAFAPLLGADASLAGTPGRVINISSAAGVRALPFLGPYAASKFALEGYSEALRRELLLFGIDVVVIGPGPVKSAIWDKAEEVKDDRYADSPYGSILTRFKEAALARGRDGYPAERLGELIYRALTTPRPRVRYAAVKGSLGEKVLAPLLPKRTLDKLIGRQLGLIPPLPRANSTSGNIGEN